MKPLQFFLAVFVSIFIILADYKFSYLNVFRHSIATFFSPIYVLINFPSELYDWIDERGADKAFLLNQNKHLNYNLNELKTKLQTFDTLRLENQKLSALLGANYTIENPTFTMARISDVSQFRLKKQMLLNKGSNNGLKMGQVVLGASGIVGQIIHTTPFYSTVLMITDPTQHVPVKNQRNGIRGVAKGLASTQNKLLVNFIEVGSAVVLGDIFVSSAIGSKFPQGYPVGKVIKIKKHSNNAFLEIQLKPAQDINKLEFVLVISD